MEIKEKITSANCLEVMNEIRIDGKMTHREAAWVTILVFCRQNGLEKEVPLSGLETVIKFLETKLIK